ncbi:porin family protein [Flavobacterium sp. K5-23]|uniref:porin family protein n=1 Tax=Flavobacterium sp. K5-23 TaxID=2746225 RepID=UPI00200CF33C|nr:porin family protein [Flavobacterium sp. K5-23]UQD55781.1 PorT family protein [Flavobacterium sp. K5-23]
MRLFLSCFLLMIFFNGYSQESESLQKIQNSKIDSLYREDQFYIGITYNTLQQKPAGLSQNKFSTGLSLGFLRDMPINKDRTIAIASGLGFTYNNYNQNLFITETNGTPVYSLIDSETIFKKNKFSQLLIDVPIEFRWRTSTYESHKFWRIHGGLKFSYLLYNKSIFDGEQGKKIVTSNKDFNKLLYGTYIAAGYNSFNVYAYYGLNSLFKSATLDGENIAMSSINIGFIFYIL